MNILALKLLLAPIIIGGASLAGRRWGPAVSGWLIGLPLTSGPVALIVSFSHGTAFTSSTVLGTLSGGIPLVVFCLSYAWLALRFKWPAAITGSMLGYGLLTLLMQNVVMPLAIIFVLVVTAILIGLRLMPAETQLKSQDEKPGIWDIPVRILIGTTFILTITAIAPYIGPRLTGLLSTIPLYTAILTIFAQRLQGSSGANSVLRGLLLGLFGFSGFYLALALSLDHIAIVPAFLLSTFTALVIQAVSFLVLRRNNSKISSGGLYE